MTDHELSADGAEVKEPGDRFLTCQPCGRSCQHLGQSQVNTEAMLAVTPYTYVFRSPVKGRWVGSSLLHLMIREFSYVPPATDSVEEGSTEATLDPRISLPAYVDELCDGRLLLHSREAECRCEGQRYRVSLAQSIQRREGGEVMDWPSCKRWIQTLESSTMAQSLVDEEDSVPKRLLLRQKDTLLHTVTRREGRIYAADPIHIMAFEPNGTPLSLMVTSKPSGLPVHPSGSYRRNSVTSILEDIFGGADTSHYTERYHYGDDDCTDELRPDCVPNYVSIVSICKRFELIRVWIRRGEDEGQSGLTMSQWEVLRQMLHRTPAVRETTDDPVRHKRQRRHDDENGSEVAPLKVFVVHRLDAATSGVLLFALNSDSAKSVAAQLAAPEPSDEVSTKEAVPYSSKKTYLAKVTGRVNLRELAESHPNSTTWRVSDVQGDDVLVVQRPIGCLNYHCSLYWCPSATHAAAWAAARRLAPTVAPTSETTSLEVSNSASERLAAKRAHMRERTLGRRPQCIDADNSAASLGEESVEAALQQFEASLRTAMTEVRVRQYCERDNTTLLECRLFTGRTHQLRVHLASLGHPIVGDSKYHDFTTLICQAREKYANTSSTTPLDEVRTFFTDHWKEHVLKREGESGRNCLCPSRIQLHALEYRLPLGSTRRVFRTPIPSWATLTDLSPAVAS